MACANAQWRRSAGEVEVTALVVAALGGFAEGVDTLGGESFEFVESLTELAFLRRIDVAEIIHKGRYSTLFAEIFDTQGFDSGGVLGHGCLKLGAQCVYLIYHLT